MKMRNSYRISAFVLMITSGLSSASNLCEKYVQPPSVNTAVDAPSLSYVPTPLAKLKQPDHISTKLAVSQISGGQIEIDTTYAVQAIPDGYCVSPQIRARAAGVKITIQLPREIPVDSCLYVKAMEIEKRHAERIAKLRSSILLNAGQKLNAQLSGNYAYFPRLSDAKGWLDKYHITANQVFQDALRQSVHEAAKINTDLESNQAMLDCATPAPKPWWKRIFSTSSSATIRTEKDLPHLQKERN